MSVIAGEGKETQSRPAEPGDWVVRNRCPETGNEQYLVKAAKFEGRYELVGPPASPGEWREAQSRWARSCASSSCDPRTAGSTSKLPGERRWSPRRVTRSSRIPPTRATSTGSLPRRSAAPTRCSARRRTSHCHRPGFHHRLRPIVGERLHVARLEAVFHTVLQCSVCDLRPSRAQLRAARRLQALTQGDLGRAQRHEPGHHRAAGGGLRRGRPRRDDRRACAKPSVSSSPRCRWRATPGARKLLARERERARRLDLQRRHAVLAARLLATAETSGDRAGREGSRRGRPLGAREALQQPLRLALAGDPRGPVGTPWRWPCWSPASGRTRSSRTRPGGSPWSRALGEARGPPAPLRARTGLVRRDGLRGLRKPGRARLRRRGAPAYGGVARRRRFAKADPGRIFELVPRSGREPLRVRSTGYYLDAISPRVATLPAEWPDRLTRIQLEPDLAAWFLSRTTPRCRSTRGWSPATGSRSAPGWQAGCCRSRSSMDASPEPFFLDEPESARAPQGARRGPPLAPGKRGHRR